VSHTLSHTTAAGALCLADDLALPLDAVTQTLAILGTRGSGKTQTGNVLAEELIEAGLRFVVIDPTGVWWGLKTSFDGREAGYPVLVVGGEHADVPVAPGMGVALADLVVVDHFCSVLDVSDLSSSEQYQVIADFTDMLYRRNREPLHLLIDEADEYAPQVPGRDQAHVLRSMDRLVRRGRVKGLGVTLITQPLPHAEQ